MLDRALNRIASAVDYDRVVRLLAPIEGFLHPLEGYALMMLAAYGPGKGTVLEIGSYLGRSTCFLALGVKHTGRPAVVALDHFAGSAEHQAGASHESAILVEEGTTYNQFLRNLERAGMAPHVRPVRAASLKAAAGWHEPLRLLFIDGDHAYEATRSDFAAWSPHLEESGLIAFHDVEVWPGVTQFYKELIGHGKWRERACVHSLRVVARA